MTLPEKKSSDNGIPTVVIDFDNTIAKDAWPSNEIGEAIQVGVDILLHYFDAGNEIVIYTARPESHKGLIWRWLKDRGLNGLVHDVVCGKPRGWVYIDDRAWNPFEAPEEPPAEWDENTPDEMRFEPPRAEAASAATSSKISTGKAQPAPGKKQAGYDDDQWTVVG